MTKMLLVEDDTAISGPLLRALGREGYDVHLAETGRGAIEAMSGGVDVAILDLGLPDMDGLDVARHARSQGWIFPILILTARSEEVDMVVGLDAGADDYVTKPFRLAELLARVRAVLRRSEASESDVIRVQDLTIDVPAHRVVRGTTELGVSGKEYDLLVVLARNAGQAVSRADIMRDVWDAPEDDASKKLDMHVSWLRRKLGDSVSDPRYISTVRGVGFRLERE
ncbi:response regulator receiver domain protein [Actinomyces sp. oral taxon 848 str. F0332]|uniref:DNA-binding response regulator n=1 Tax=Peptidiphaga gingivicola TaxID=2741497 RepID=A0A179B445_9ACTO|nr:response regulator transcription factor [Peptidiphaga gingivicola]EEZ77579.1 response regulator receiver domain protein [Actinomyces sp. oral taxon 848 str. F0332]OAP86462.1 DNA-binding response regulator [Peptidiphaga gingivicola]